jgi:hypothetical protein
MDKEQAHQPFMVRFQGGCTKCKAEFTITCPWNISEPFTVECSTCRTQQSVYTPKEDS